MKSGYSIGFILLFLDTIKEDKSEDGIGNTRRKQERGPTNESSDAPRDGKNDPNQGDSASSGITHGGNGHDE